MQQPPKNMKFRKRRKCRIRGRARRSALHFGDFGLRIDSPCRLTPRQIESARRAMVRALKRGGKVWIRVFPDWPVSKKPLEVRQGKGKGNVEYFVFPCRPGTIVFEIGGVPLDLAKEAVRLAISKLPAKASFIMREMSEMG
jgi:large subunit ribosomal protein L16